MRTLMAALVAAAMAVGGATPGRAQDYPTRPITLVVPYSAGGAATT